ncbi:MAG TPA: hypothetical protein VKX28_15850 [Xanthobacteraceae bacterium]|nr:hypothetical protein [Xanthobacteraceae bacterium]
MRGDFPPVTRRQQRQLNHNPKRRLHENAFYCRRRALWFDRGWSGARRRPAAEGAAGADAYAATWIGLYVGVNVSLGRQSADSTYTGSRPGNFIRSVASGALPAEMTQTGSGVLGGFALGYNLQGGPFVYGIEADAM